MRFSLAILGQKGERLAARHIKRNGGRVVERNWRSKVGELDLIVMDGNALAFVEVKGKSSTEHGRPGEQVNQKKRRKIETLATHFCRRRRIEPEEMRFDVVEVVWNDPPEIQWIKSAWLAGE